MDLSGNCSDSCVKLKDHLQSLHCIFFFKIQEKVYLELVYKKYLFSFPPKTIFKGWRNILITFKSRHITIFFCWKTSKECRCLERTKKSCQNLKAIFDNVFLLLMLNRFWRIHLKPLYFMDAILFWRLNLVFQIQVQFKCFTLPH